jgi:hypothetical protein
VDWDSLAKFFLSIVSISGVLAYVGKKAVDAFFYSRIATHKAELQRTTTGYSIRFQKLHAERAEVIIELYEKLVALDLSLQSTLRFFQLVNEPTLEEKIKELSEKHNALFYFYLPKKIFLEQRVCARNSRRADGEVEGLVFRHHDVSGQSAASTVQVRSSAIERATPILAASAGCVSTEITELRTELEREFRAILGIDA